MKPQFIDHAAYRQCQIGGGLSEKILNLLMPPQCPVTGEAVIAPGVLSPKGWAALHFIEAPFCDHCGVPYSTDYGEGVLCPSCIADPPSFIAARAALSYNNAAGKFVSDLKFNDRLDQVAMLARWMIRAGGDVLKPGAIIAPVPLHWRRLAARRFNQSGLLAAEIAKQSGFTLLQRAVHRHRATPPQREIMSVSARRRNVMGAFQVKQKFAPHVRGAHVILIDDVLTTGATISAAAGALRRAGADRVDALVLARVVKGGGGAI